MYKGITEYRFCKTAGVPKTFFQFKPYGLSDRSMHKIGQAFPELNLHWVATGEGDMLNSGHDLDNDSLMPGDRDPIALLDMRDRDPIALLDMRDRIRAFAIYKRLTNYHFSKAAGLSPNFLYAESSQRISDRSLHKIGQAFPELNLHWVATGEGDMLNSGHDLDNDSLMPGDRDPIALLDMRDRIKAYISHKRLTNYSFCKTAGLSEAFFHCKTQRLSNRSLHKIGQAFPDLNLHWVFTGQGDMLNGGHDLDDDVNVPMHIHRDIVADRDKKIERLNANIEKLKRKIKKLETSDLQK